MRAAVLALAILAATPIASLAQTTGLSPIQIGEMFCSSMLTGDEAPARALASPVLLTAIAYAEARNDVIARAYPDEKPPLGDGIPWTSFPDYAVICTVGDVATIDGTTTVAIHYGFPEDPSVTYVDRLALTTIPAPDNSGTLNRIDDVLFDGGGSLRGALVTLFEQ